MHKFITIEGTEGCGKTTQIKHLSDLLQQHNIPVVATREPGGCTIADKIRSILLDPTYVDMASTTELLLYAAARAQHVEQVIRPALDTGKAVICDRFTDATMAYQGYGRGLERTSIEKLALLACGSIEPSLTLWLDLPAEMGLKRALARNHTLDLDAEARFEQESLKFHLRVQHGYTQLQLHNPQRIKRIDASGTAAQVAQRIAAVVKPHIRVWN